MAMNASKQGRTGRGTWLLLPLLFALVIIAAGPVLAGNLGDKGSGVAPGERSLDARAEDLARQLWCPVCEGQTVAESNSTVAVRMKQTIRSMLAEGATPEEIREYFVGLYGPGILAAPPAQGIGLLAWFSPGAGLVVGLALALLALLRRRPSRRGRPGVSAASPGDDSPGHLDPAARERLERELGRYL